MSCIGPEHRRSKRRAFLAPAVSSPFVRPPTARLGAVLGAYRLLEVVGQGGMGTVYRAEHIRLGRQVALKLLHPEYACRSTSVARFLQEARAVNRIRHDNIVDVTDLIELDDGSVFIIMELLDGESLGALMRCPGALDTNRALGILIQICDALSAAHEVGIVHRDLKPDNVVITTRDDGDGGDLVKLLDFGVAKLLEEDVSLLTVAGAVLGTPAFMSPEQARCQPVDGRSDVYALGAIMYELFTGQPLFRGRNFHEYAWLHTDVLPTPPSQTPRGGSIRRPLERIIMRCLEKRPDRRWGSARDLKLALEAEHETTITARFVRGEIEVVRHGDEPTVVAHKRPRPVGFPVSCGPHSGDDPIDLAEAMTQVAPAHQDYGAPPSLPVAGPRAAALPPPLTIETRVPRGRPWWSRGRAAISATLAVAAAVAAGLVAATLL